MSISPVEGVELDLQQARTEGLLPYIALERMRLADELGLVEADQSATFNATSQNTRFNLHFQSPNGQWVLRGWEEAGLSAGGSFPRALEEYSDGFVINMDHRGSAVVRAERSHYDDAVPLSGFGFIALKDILWDSQLAFIDQIPQLTADQLGDKEEIDDPKVEYQDALGAFQHLCAFAHTVEQMKSLTDELNDGSADTSVFSYGVNGLAEHLLEDFSALGEYEGERVVAWVHRTPDVLKRRISPDQHVAKIGLNLNKVHNFVGVDNVPIETSMSNFFFDEVTEEVNIVPQDSMGTRIALDRESLQKLASILRSLMPVSSHTTSD